ncbi:hypothetical protein VTK26DRAFT_689 [Humicola hyalothermophila]
MHIRAELQQLVEDADVRFRPVQHGLMPQSIDHLEQRRPPASVPCVDVGPVLDKELEHTELLWVGQVNGRVAAFRLRVGISAGREQQLDQRLFGLVQAAPVDTRAFGFLYGKVEGRQVLAVVFGVHGGIHICASFNEHPETVGCRFLFAFEQNVPLIADACKPVQRRRSSLTVGTPYLHRDLASVKPEPICRTSPVRIGTMLEE